MLPQEGRLEPRENDWVVSKMGSAKKNWRALRKGQNGERELFNQQGPDGTEISTFVSKGGWHGCFFIDESKSVDGELDGRVGKQRGVSGRRKTAARAAALYPWASFGGKWRASNVEGFCILYEYVHRAYMLHVSRSCRGRELHRTARGRCPVRVGRAAPRASGR